MGMRRMFTPVCDCCSTDADFGEWYADTARDRAREDGWHVNGSRFICPECWDAGKRWPDIG